jgi:hypothetical protein
MRVEYEVTADDITEFTRHILRTHPGFRRTYLLGFLAGPAWVFCSSWRRGTLAS